MTSCSRGKITAKNLTATLFVVPVVLDEERKTIVKRHISSFTMSAERLLNSTANKSAGDPG